MARPITWQEVAAPQTAGTLAAAAMASRNFNESLDKINNRFGQIGANMDKAATDAATAFVMNSQDPTAAAQQIPINSPHINPLAVAGAVQVKARDLLQTKSTEAQIRSNELQGQIAQATLDDRLASNQGADLALPYRDLIFAGKKPNIDLNDPRWQTAAGREALKFIDGWQKEYNDQQYQQGSLALSRLQAQMAQAQFNETRATRDAQAWIENFISDPKNAAQTEGELRDSIRTEFQKRGLGHLVSSGVNFAEQTRAGYTPTAAQLEAVADPNTGLTFLGARQAYMEQHQENLSRNNARLGDLTLANQGAIQDRDNPYNDVADDDLTRVFQEKHPETNKDAVFFNRWDKGDINQRVAEIEDWARKNGKPITRKQAFSVLQATIGATSFGLDSTQMIMTDEAKSQVRALQASNEIGGWKEVQRLQAEVEAANAISAANLERNLRKVDLSARAGDGSRLDQDLISRVAADPVVRAQNIENNQIPALRVDMMAAAQAGDAARVQEINNQIQRLQTQANKLRDSRK